ncbi:acyl carrier protein [Pseudofrankia asymbiotica]|uniref:Phosphopantetheine-binding protein n=1 Tax=Pseudofrankia asymbiotica TaxID=1834516 RepID=A0A1V2IEE7_9ACTN|nr:acyl carrier protein [Pseudofrankia asymbiotica]ONH31455.1 phosphopantetheine-binding protein [Pseudofrankia asymbiotica]
MSTAQATTTHDEIVATVTGIVAQELGVPAESLAPDADLRSVEGADSVKVLRMIAKVEREYDVELEDEQVFAVNSIDGVATVVLDTLAQDAA